MKSGLVKILVVDDVEQNLLAMSAAVATEGVEVLTASSGREALELLQVHVVALAILDVQMPDMDGYALAELMRGAERTRHVPIVFVTAGVKEDQRSFRAYESGAVDFLYKPIDPLVLRSKVGVFAELFRQSQLLATRLTEVERLSRVNALMVAALTHDIRSPLTALALNAEMLLRRDGDSAVHLSGQRIKAATSMLSRQVDHLTNLAQYSHGELAPLLQQGDVAPVISKCVDEAQSSTLVTAAFAFSQEGDCACYFDAVMLSTAVDYLLLQAATHSDGAQVTVRLDGNGRRFVTLQISFASPLADSASHHLFDSGGVALNDLSAPRVGPGLYMPERIARAHGGSLIGRSLPNEGSLFELVLPRGVTTS